MTSDLLVLGNINLDLIVGPLEHWPAPQAETGSRSDGLAAYFAFTDR